MVECKRIQHYVLILLDLSLKTHNIPGKFLSYLYAGLPVFASINKGNDLEKIIDKYELGKYSSKVLSILDEDSVIPVISKKTKKSFFIKGGGEKKLFLKHIDKPFELEHGELVLTTSAAGYFQKGISVGKIVKTLDDVYVKPFAKVSDSIYVNVLIFDFKNILEE